MIILQCPAFDFRHVREDLIGVDPMTTGHPRPRSGDVIVNMVKPITDNVRGKKCERRNGEWGRSRSVQLGLRVFSFHVTHAILIIFIETSVHYGKKKQRRCSAFSVLV